MRTKAAPITIADMRWLNKAEAMAYTHRKSEERFDEEFGKRVPRYNGGGRGRSFLYDKRDLDRIIKSMVEMKGIDL